MHGIQTTTYKLRFPGEIVADEFQSSYFWLVFVTLFDFCWMTRAVCFVFLRVAGVMIFHDFLKSQYSEENLLFWLAVEKLKKETDQAAVKEHAQSIYRDYLSAESPKEVSNNIYIIYVRELLSNSERIIFVRSTRKRSCLRSYKFFTTEKRGNPNKDFFSMAT